MDKIPREVYELALDKFNRKIAMPQYESYLGDNELLMALMQDCVSECEFALALKYSRNRGGATIDNVSDTV
jgi:hypothetical protein